MRGFGIVVAILIATTSYACIWDSDTLSREAKGELDVLDAIVGRFDRYPAQYYERRLQIAVDRLEKNPADLASYDNAATACDRLGRDDDAILWMRRKRKHLAGADSDALYRTEANEGTFWAHKWFAAGAREEDEAWLAKGRDMIAKAIEINPNAHFGREKVQLGVIEWALQGANERLAIFLMKDKPKSEAKEIRRGLVGLVVLGNSWQSLDVLGAIGETSRQDNAIADLVGFRIETLKKEGKKSLLGDAFQYQRYGMSTRAENNRENFDLLTRSAKDYDANLQSFVTRQLAKGLHPDLDRTAFWAGYVEVSRPSLIEPPLLTRVPLPVQVGVLAVFVILATTGIQRLLKRRRAA